MSDNITLSADERTITGKQVKLLRSEGLVPGIIYGPGKPAINVQIRARALKTALAQAGGSQLIDLTLADEQSIPVLVRDVQRDNLRDTLLHVDFYAVRMDQAIRAEIPVEFINESPLVEARQALLVTGATVIEIESFPGDLPASLEVDLALLVDMDSTLTAGDLPLTEGVTLITDENEMVATLNYLADLEEEEEELEEEDLLYDAEAVEVIGRGRDEEEGEEDYF